MRSAVLRKSVTDLTRRKARSSFAVATLTLAVTSVGILALPSLADRAMRKEMAESRLPHLTLSTRPLELSAAQLGALARIPNVVAVEPRSDFFTRAYVGERRADALVVGVRDFGRQDADVVDVTSGAPPGPEALLSEAQNARQDRYDGGAGDVLRVISAGGEIRALRVSGTGRNLQLGQEVVSEDWIVLYATPETVAGLRGGSGYTSLAFRLRDTSPAAVESTVAGVDRYLRATTAFTSFTELPSVRDSATWPGKEEVEDLSTVLSIVSLLALVSAFVLISTTMTTLVGEQTGEIGTMKALGARRRQIAGVYLRTALLLGALGAVVGSLLGVVLANVLNGFFLSTFFAVEPGFAVDVPTVLVSLALGVAGPPLAALPSIRRAVRLSVREAIQATGSAVGGPDAVGTALRSVRFLPRTAQIGLGGVGRRMRRSLATTLQVALAVATLLAMTGLATGATESSRLSWSSHDWDLWLGSGLERPLDARAARLIRSAPGVAEAEPVITSDVELGGREAFVWGVGAQTRLRYRLASGRWYSAAEEQSRARVAVVERNIARLTATEVGDVVRATTVAGPVKLRVVGIASNQQEDGTVLYVPLETVRAVLGAPDVANGYWIATESPAEGLIDRTATRLEDVLTAAGYDVGIEITYVAERDEIAKNRTLTTTITVLGFLIVAISMVGLANAITMSVLERTREIGVLRTIGARARDVRRIFAAEGLAMAVLGWLLGMPLGYALDRALVWLIERELDVQMVFAFPPWNLPLALVGTVVLGLLVMLVPIRRAVRLRPGEAIRYA
jgi:putative ABC transport system permease protein